MGAEANILGGARSTWSPRNKTSLHIKEHAAALSPESPRTLAAPRPLSPVAAIIVAGPMLGKGSPSGIGLATFEYYMVIIIVY